VCSNGGERPLSFGCRSGRIEVEGSLTQEALGRVGSSPDKAGTGQYCQMVRVRRTRQKGVTQVNQWWNLRNRGTGSNLADLGRAAVHADLTDGKATLGTAIDVGSGGHEECLRRTRGDAAGAELDTDPADRHTVNMGTLPHLPFPACLQHVGGQGRCHLRCGAGGGAAVVVRGRESRLHGEGRQQAGNDVAVTPGGRR